MKKSIFLNTLRLLLLTAAAALFAPDNALGQTPFKVTVSYEGGGEDISYHSTLKDALETNYEDGERTISSVLIYQTESYSANNEVITPRGNMYYELDMSEDFTGSLTLNINNCNLNIQGSSDNININAQFNIGENGQLSIAGGTYTNTTGNVIQISSNGKAIISGGTTFIGSSAIPEGANIVYQCPFKAKYGDNITTFFDTFQETLKYEYPGNSDITITQLNDYQRDNSFFGDEGLNTNNKCSISGKKISVNLTKSISDTLWIQLNGGELSFNCEQGSSNFYGTFELTDGATLTLNGGNYDFYKEIVNIGSGCTANISNTNFVTDKNSGEESYGWSTKDVSKDYGYCIENNGGTLNVSSGTFSHCTNNDWSRNISTSGGYGISVSEGSETELSGGEFSGETSAIFNGNGNEKSVLKDGYAFFVGEKQIEENYEENKTLANSTTSEAYKTVSVDIAAIILGKGAKYKVAGTFSDYNADADKAQGVWAEQSGGQWYIMTSSAVSEGSYTVTESETNTIKIKIKDYFKDVLEQKWYRAITVYTRSKSISENAGFYKNEYNEYRGQTISTNIDTDHKIYVNGETTDETSFFIDVDGDGKTEVTLELRDDDGNVYALKKRTINFDKYKPNITIECDGVAVPQVSTHEPNITNEVVILPDSKLSFKFNDNKAPDGSNLSGDKISAFGGIVYNDGTNDHVFTDSTTAATGIDAKDLAGKTVIYYAFDKAGNGLDYGDSLKVTFVLAKFKATYKQDNKDVTKYFSNLKDALTSSNYTDEVTDITIETLENEITDQSTEDIEVKDKNFTFITNGKNVTATCRIKVTSGKLTINGGTFIGTSRPFAAIEPVISADGGHVVITDGVTIKNDYGNAVGSFEDGTIKINGGSFESQNNCLYVGEGGTAEVNEGTFTSTGENSYAVSISELASSLEINGGTFTGKSYGLSCNMASATLSGGTFIGGEAAISHDNTVLENGYAFYDQNGKMLIFKNNDGNYVLDDFSLLDASGAAYTKLSVKAVTATVIPDEMTLGKGAKVAVEVFAPNNTYTFAPVTDGAKTLITAEQEQEGGKWYVKTADNVVDGSYTLSATDNSTVNINIKVTIKDYFAELFDGNDDWYNKNITVKPAAKNNDNDKYSITVQYLGGDGPDDKTANTDYTDLALYIDEEKLTADKEYISTAYNVKFELRDSKNNVLASSVRDLKIEKNSPTLILKNEDTGETVEVGKMEDGVPDNLVNYEVISGTKLSFVFDDTNNGVITDEEQISGFWQIVYKLDNGDNVVINESTATITVTAADFNNKQLQFVAFDKAGNYSDTSVVTLKVVEKITADDIAALINLTKEYDGGIYATAGSGSNKQRLYNSGSDVTLAYKGIYLNFNSVRYVDSEGNDSKDAGKNKTLTAKFNSVKYPDNTNNIIYVIDGAKTGEDFTISTEGEITARPINVTEGITAEDKTYDGTTDAALNFENAVLSGLIDGDDKPAITATGTFEDENAGENKTVTISEIKIKLNEGEVSNYKIATADNQSETTATITAKKVESPVITIDVEEIVYNGEAQKPAITVKDGETVIPSDEFEITYENNTDAGTATIKITDKSGGNYVISDKETAFEIAKANPEFSKEPESAGALSFTGQAQPLLTAGETSDGEILYRLGEDGEYSSEIPSASAPGVYTVYCKIVGDKNHNDSEEDFKVTVRILQQTVSYTLGKNAEIKLPYPETVVFTSDNSNVSVTDNVLKTTSSVKDGDKAVLTSENYVISVTIVEPLKSIEIEDIWHNGDVHLKAPDMSAFDEGSELHINGHKVEDIENEVISEEGENTVVYEIKDPESNIICHEERIIKIDKSAPDTKAEASSVNKTRYNITVTVDGGMKYFFRNGAEAGFNVTDLFSGVKSMEYSWDNKDNFQNLDPSTLVGLKSGAHTLYIRVSDNAGNTEILSTDFTVFDDSKFANGSDTVISLPVYYSSDEIESQTFDINLNGNTVFAIKDSKDGVYYGKTTDGVYFTGNVLTVTSDYLKTLKPDGENMLYVYINPLGGEGWNEDFTPKDYECQIMKIKLDIIYEVRVNGDYKFTAPNDNSITTFCDGEDVMLTFTLDTKYSKADFVSIETMEVYNEDLKEQITFRIPKGALKGGNEPLKLTFRKESYTADDTVTFPGDYPSEYNIKVYDDVIAIDNSGQHFLNDQYTWFIDMKEIPGETKQFLDLLKYMTDGQKHSFSVKVVDVTGGSFRVCPDESFTIESIGKRKAVSVNVYPNPAESGKMFYIELENFGEENFPNTEILIYNQLGTVVEKISAVEKLNPVSLKEGFYSGAVLVSGKKMLNFKIIVK